LPAQARNKCNSPFVSSAPFLDLGDSTAGDHIIQGVLGERGNWRWTLDHAVLVFSLNGSLNWELRTRFSVTEETFSRTGPLTMSFSINHKLIATETVNEPGERVFTCLVPKGVIQSGELTEVMVDTEPSWISPKDGAKLAFLLQSIGFVSKA